MSIQPDMTSKPTGVSVQKSLVHSFAPVSWERCSLINCWIRRTHLKTVKNWRFSRTMASKAALAAPLAALEFANDDLGSAASRRNGWFLALIQSIPRCHARIWIHTSSTSRREGPGGEIGESDSFGGSTRSSHHPFPHVQSSHPPKTMISSALANRSRSSKLREGQWPTYSLSLLNSPRTSVKTVLEERPSHYIKGSKGSKRKKQTQYTDKNT